MGSVLLLDSTSIALEIDVSLLNCCLHSSSKSSTTFSCADHGAERLQGGRGGSPGCCSKQVSFQEWQ